MGTLFRLLTLFFMAVAAIAAGVVAFPRHILGSKRGALPGKGSRSGSSSERDPMIWLEGDDLLRYPRRLSELEQQLADSHREAELQENHLTARLSSMEEKSGRESLATRYREDLILLQRRIESMKRVLGLVWRTRAILEMRAHLAITARQRPNLDFLPEDQIPTEDLESVAGDYDSAARQVRRFVGNIGERADELPMTIPRAPSDAEITDVLRSEVAAEKEQILAAYQQLRERMDHLDDTLTYLSDRCRTRRVFEGSAAGLSGVDAGGEALINEVESALSELNDLAEVGELHLADSTLEALAEGISQLEQAGLEVQAEADAAIEVAKLLEQFQS